MGVTSELLRVGEPPTPSRLNTLTDGAATVFIHAGGESLSREQLGNLRKIVGCRLIAFAHNPQVPKNWDLFDTVVPVSEYVRQTLLFSGMQTTRVLTDLRIYRLPICLGTGRQIILRLILRPKTLSMSGIHPKFATTSLAILTKLVFDHGEMVTEHCPAGMNSDEKIESVLE